MTKGDEAAREDSPSRLGLSGKNSERTGKTHPLFLMIGFTNEAVFWSNRRASSALCLSFRCVKDLTYTSVMVSLRSRSIRGALVCKGE